MYQILSSFHIDGYLESCIGGRSENQDACGFSDTPIGALVIVCDGMGGVNGGSIASSTAVKTIITFFSQASEQDDPIELIKSAVNAANKAILDTANSDSSLTGMGTTLVLTLINERCAYVTSIGDSRIYQLRSKRKVFRTEDDSIVFQLVKSKAITEEEARTSDSSNIITKALGISAKLDFDILTLPYDKYDRFLLCTDGFWGSMPEPEMLDMLNKKGDLSLFFDRALRKVEKIGRKNNPNHFDNYTMAVFDVGKYSKQRSLMEKRLMILSLVLFFLLIASMALSYSLYRNIHQSNEDSREQISTGNATTPTDSVRATIDLPAEKAVTDTTKKL